MTDFQASELRGLPVESQTDAMADFLRTARMNCKYYGIKVERFTSLSQFIDCTQMIVSSSVIAGWLIWKQGYGELLWKSMAGLVTILAIIKVAYRFQDKIKRYSTLWAGYTELSFKAQKWVDRIKAGSADKKGVDEALSSISEQMGKLGLQDDPVPDKKLLGKCYAEVEVELPIESVFPKARLQGG